MPKREWKDVPEGAFTLSVTQLQSLELSPCRITTIPPGVRIPPSERMFFGTVSHALIERYERNPIDGDTRGPLSLGLQETLG